jgi:hypothetical protein
MMNKKTTIYLVFVTLLALLLNLGLALYVFDIGYFLKMFNVDIVNLIETVVFIAVLGELKSIWSPSAISFTREYFPDDAILIAMPSCCAAAIYGATR